MRELSEFEHHLVDLVQFISARGLSLKDVKTFLNTKSKEHRNMTPLEAIQKTGGAFLNELKTYMNENEIG